MGISTFHTEGEVRAAVAGARSLSDALKALGLRAAGGNYATINRLIALWDIPTGHLDPNWTRRGAGRPQERKPLSEILVEHSTYQRAALKRRLYDTGLKARCCEACEQGEEWQGRHMSLILDHVNGVHDDNRLENLRILCPNCNATLDTHCGRQNQNGPRDCRHCGAEFRPRYTRQQYCSQDCGTRSAGPRKPKPETRKVERPSEEQLLRELEETNFSAVGRKYGVSDGAIRKWVRAYQWQREHPEPTAMPIKPD